MLALTSAILAAHETLLPLFDGDEHRTILFLQHVVGAVARRPFEIPFEALGDATTPSAPSRRRATGRRPPTARASAAAAAHRGEDAGGA
jgi:hypothetical protein